jgi:hypothetical protein
MLAKLQSLHIKTSDMDQDVVINFIEKAANGTVLRSLEDFVLFNTRKSILQLTPSRFPVAYRL